MKAPYLGRTTFAIGTLALVLGGCSSFSPLNALKPADFAASTKSSVPDVQHCLNVNGGTGGVTTPEYVCNGKMYTSHELYKLREQSASGSSSSHS
jgi:hypothetical protein